MKTAAGVDDSRVAKEAREDEYFLDPENWEAFRALAHRMVDEMVDQTRDLREQPAWQQPPDEVKQAIQNEPLPLEGQSAERAYDDYLRLVQPYTSGNRHPRAWGWVRGSGTPLAAMAEMLAAAMNTHAGGGEQSSTFVEERCLRWLAEAMGMPASTTGILTSGGTMANLLVLAVALAGPGPLPRGAELAAVFERFHARWRARTRCLPAYRDPYEDRCGDVAAAASGRCRWIGAARC